MAQYIVKKGDNLSTIAKKNGIKLNEILKLNKLDDPNLIQIGQKINLPVKVESTNTISLKNNTTKPYKEFLENQLKVKTPENNWKKITPSIQGKTIAEFDKKKDTPTKQVINKPITKPITKEEEESFFSQIKNKISETYSDIKTAVDQQTSKKTVAKPEVKIDDSFIDYGYKELGTYKDESFKAGKKDSLLSAMNVFDNDRGFDYIVSPKIKEGKKTFNNVKGVAHFLMDSDITPNQKYTTPYIEKGNNTVKSAQAGKFTPYLGKNPDDYVMYYKNTGNSKMNVKYGQLKDKDKYKGYEQIKVRSIPFGELDFNNKKSAGFAKKASYIGTLDGKQTSIITNPESNDVYGRFSGGSGIFYFKEPKTGKTISVDVSGSVNTIKQVGEELSKKYNVDPKQLQFLYHDMGSYSAKPKSHNGVISNEQWENYNSNNKGYSGAALMYPMEFGGKIYKGGGTIVNTIPKIPPVSESTKIVRPNKYEIEDANDTRLRVLEYESKDFMTGWLNSPMYKKMFEASKSGDETPIPPEWANSATFSRSPLIKNNPGTAGIYKSGSDSIVIKDSHVIDKNAGYETAVHEDSHSSDNVGDKIPANDVKKMKSFAEIKRKPYYGELSWFDKFLYDKNDYNKSVKEDFDFKNYVATPTETRARLNVIRALGKKQGVYDPFTQPITKEQLKKIKFLDNGYAPLEQLKTIYSDDEILNMLNSISMNQNIQKENNFEPYKAMFGMGGGQGGGNGAGMIMQGVTQAIGGIFSTLDAQKKATEQQGQQNLQNAYQMQQINDLKAMELEQQQQFFPKGGKVEPIYTDNPKDKRLKAYNDSLKIYNSSEKIKNEFLKKQTSDEAWKYSMSRLPYDNDNKIQPIKWLNLVNQGVSGGYPQYKKPVQPVIYKKEVNVPVPKVNYLKNILQTDEEDIKIDFNSNLPIPQAPNEDEQTTKGKPLPDYLIQQVKTPNGMKTYIRKDTNSPWLEQDFEKGGIVKAWIQKFSKGGYIADGGFPGGQELTQPTTNYYNWGNYGNQNSFLTPEQINQKPFQNTVPLANTNMSQNIGTNYFTPYDASNDQVNKDNQLASSMMKSSSKGLSDPVSMGLDIGGKSLDATANLLGSLGKDNSKAQAFGQGASGAMNVASQVTAPFKDIPIAGKAIDAVGKTLGFFIGGALNARKQGIKNEEMDKYNKLQEYTSRNTQTAQQPSYYGQYMSKYGSNIKNMEQRIIDDIYSDFDKHFKLK